MEQQRAPLREPMVWLVIALPLASVIAALLLVLAALRSGGDDAVADPVQRTAQIQVSELGPDTQAQQRQLSAVLRVSGGLVQVFPASGEFDRRHPLVLNLRHPARADADLLLKLEPIATGWQAKFAVGSGHDWQLQLSPADGHWRIQGRLRRGQLATRLGPALSAP